MTTETKKILWVKKTANKINPDIHKASFVQRQMFVKSMINEK